MGTATTIRTGATIAATLYTGILLVLGLYPSQFRYLFAYIPAAVGYGVVAFDKWAWHWPVIHHFTGRPWVTGTWRVILSPSRDSHIPEGGNRGRVTAYLTIEQTFWSLHATLRTREHLPLKQRHHQCPRELRHRRDRVPLRQHAPRGASASQPPARRGLPHLCHGLEPPGSNWALLHEPVYRRRHGLHAAQPLRRLQHVRRSSGSRPGAHHKLTEPSQERVDAWDAEKEKGL